MQCDQASEGPWSSDDNRGRQACRVTLPIPQQVPLLHQWRKTAENSTPTEKSSDRTIPVLSADYCFIGAEMAANESPVLVMVDPETSMVFAHVHNRKGAAPDQK